MHGHLESIGSSFAAQDWSIVRITPSTHRFRLDSHSGEKNLPILLSCFLTMVLRLNITENPG